MQKTSRKSRLLLLAGIDFHVLATLLSRGWSLVAGALTVLLVPFWLTTTEQGYYYTFFSLLGMQILFELGLGQVIIQLVSHDVAELRQADSGELHGDASRIDRLASLTQLLRRWYILAAALFAVVAGGAGGYFLAVKGQLPWGHWLPVWTLLVIATAVNLSYVPALALQEGLGRIGQVARLRLIQSVVGYSALWLALLGHLGLWAACTVPIASVLLTGFWIGRFARVHHWLRARRVAPGNALNWARDVMPFQWRIALSAISGYFIFYAFTPLIFANRGAAEAGRFGIAMTVFNALAAVGTSWIYAKTPQLAMHIARGERTQLNALFIGLLRRSFLFTTGSALSVVAVAVLLEHFGVPQLQRISEPAVLLCLAIVCAANSVIFSVAAYMRAHKEEPMLAVSVVGAVLTALIAHFGSSYSVLVMSSGYALLTTLVLLPWSLMLFLRFYRRP